MWDLMSAVSLRSAQLRRRLADHVELLAALALACVYLATMSGHFESIDGLLMYWQARSIAFDHSLRFAKPIWWGTTYTSSKYGIGLSLLYIPSLLLFSFLARSTPTPPAGTYDWSLLYSDRLYTVAGAPIHALITAAAAFMVARFIRALGFSRSTALWGLALYGIASPAIIYARGDWAQPLEGLCWLVALYCALRIRQTGRLHYLWPCGLAVAYGILTRPVEGVLVVPCLIVLVTASLRWRTWPRTAWYVAATAAGASAVGIVVTLLINWGRFGSPLDTGYFANEGWTLNFGRGLIGNLVSPARGIIWAFPACVLALLGISHLWRAGQRSCVVALVVLTVGQLLNSSAWWMWWGGSDWGPRLLVPILPILAILAACGIPALPGRVRTVMPAFLVILAVLWFMPGLVNDLNYAYGSYGGPDGGIQSFSVRSYPALGGWHRLRLVPLTPTDRSAIDILWTRIAVATHGLSLLIPAMLLAICWALVRRVRDLLEGETEPQPDGASHEDQIIAAPGRSPSIGTRR